MRYKQLADKQWLQEQINNKTMQEVASEVGCTYSAITHAMRKHGTVLPEGRKRKKSLTRVQSCKDAYAKKWPEGRFGNRHPKWKGGTRIHQNYIQVYAPSHPRASKTNPYVFEHIMVAESKLERSIGIHEVVHHINGDKQDNRPENLDVLLRKDHVHAHHIKGTRITGLHTEIDRLKALLDKHSIQH